jgi:hypothetical protein
MRFDQATSQFRDFLSRQGHSQSLEWCVLSDLAFLGADLAVRQRPERAGEVEILFNEAVAKGAGVSLEAVALLEHRLCAIVRMPDCPENAASRFISPSPEITMKVRSPLLRAFEPSSLSWYFLRATTSRRTKSEIQLLFG